MVSIRVCALLVLALAILVVPSKSESGCAGSPELCQESRFMRFITDSVHRFNENNASLEIIPGLEIVKSTQQVDEDGRSNDIEGGSILSEVSRYMNNHEVKIKFKELFGRANIKAAKNYYNYLIEDEPVEEGKGKKDKGAGMVMMMGLLMGKMMATLGLGGIAALAMKALGVSSLALLLAGMLGLKKLTEGGQGDGGHHVEYVSSHGSHHRKRRDANEGSDLPYRGWTGEALN